MPLFTIEESLSISLRREAKGFCPTGPGGGVDNSCGRGGGGGGFAGAVSHARNSVSEAEGVVAGSSATGRWRQNAQSRLTLARRRMEGARPDSSGMDELEDGANYIRDASRHLGKGGDSAGAASLSGIADDLSARIGTAMGEEGFSGRGD